MIVFWRWKQACARAQAEEEASKFNKRTAWNDRACPHYLQGGVIFHKRALLIPSAVDDVTVCLSTLRRSGIRWNECADFRGSEDWQSYCSQQFYGRIYYHYIPHKTHAKYADDEQQKFHAVASWRQVFVLCLISVLFNFTSHRARLRLVEAGVLDHEWWQVMASDKYFGPSNFVMHYFCATTSLKIGKASSQPVIGMHWKRSLKESWRLFLFVCSKADLSNWTKPYWPKTKPKKPRYMLHCQTK